MDNSLAVLIQLVPSISCPSIPYPYLRVALTFPYPPSPNRPFHSLPAQTNVDLGLVAVPSVAVIVAVNLYFVVDPRRNYYNPLTDRSMEGVWAFPRAFIPIFNLFILSCAVSLILRYQVECHSEERTEEDHFFCLEEDRLFYFLVGIPVPLNFLYFFVYFDWQHRRVVWATRTFIGCLEVVFFSATLIGLSALCIIEGSFATCYIEDCYDLRDYFFLGNGIFMIGLVVVGAALAMVRKNDSQPAALSAVPSQPDIQV